MSVKSNSDFLFIFDAVMSNPNGDPDRENMPRMDYETNTLLVSDARRKRDVRNFIKTKGYPIFVDTLADNKVSMETMFDVVIGSFLQDEDKTSALFKRYNILQELVETTEISVKGFKQYLNKRRVILNILKSSKAKDGLEKLNTELLEDKKNNSELIKIINLLLKDTNKKYDLYNFTNEFLTAIIKESLIDIRWFGSAMAIEGVPRIYTGPIQLNWGYSLHPVELVQSSTISSIMNDDNSTFGKKYKIYYALTAHYGTISKRNAEKTGMSVDDVGLFRKALVQGLMNNQTDSKQGQSPLLYLEIVYKPEFDGYLGDLRRFIKVTNKENLPIRQLTDLHVDFSLLCEVLKKVSEKYEKILLWKHPVLAEKVFENLFVQVEELGKLEELDLFTPIVHKGD
ncbi:MAG: hypothetical protein VR68_04650 [Peptococcaceae bacterium BRH_c4a]|nr:MAG: hypothetical protein VR68_04650 [Peptococcaceae bacterium BRH_c4a]